MSLSIKGSKSFICAESVGDANPEGFIDYQRTEVRHAWGLPLSSKLTINVNFISTSVVQAGTKAQKVFLLICSNTTLQINTIFLNNNLFYNF